MSYNTVAEALTYFTANKLYTDAWTEAEPAQQTVALNMAYNIIEQLPLKGYRTSSGQANQFPRDGATTTPAAITIAEAEIAYSILDEIDPESELRQLEIKSTQFTSIKTTYGSHALWRAYGVPSAIAWKYLTPYVAISDTIQLSKV